jgi:3-dehydroquinate synthase
MMSGADDSYTQRFSVSYEYPVHFTRGVFASGNNLLADTLGRLNERSPQRVQVFIDSGVVAARPSVIREVEQYFADRADVLKLEGAPEIVPGGEESKNSRDAAETVMESIADHHLCRQSFVVGIGGGSALDVIGLAAALVHRGVRLVRIPTTVLAQNDSGVGVKNGIDAYGVKNFAGTFAPPFGVLVDFDFLETLADKYWRGGIAEAYKVALIKDAPFFDYLCEHAVALRERDAAAMEHVVRQAALLHLEHIGSSGDPFEYGAARPLDFGHWAAHRLEILSGYELGHGQAVAIGIALDSYYARRKGLISDRVYERILDGLSTTGLPIWTGLLERRDTSGELEVLRGLEDFREHLGGELHVTLPNGIGDKVEVNEMEPDLIRAAIAHLKAEAERRGRPDA